jgi:amidohydrolase
MTAPNPFIPPDVAVGPIHAQIANSIRDIAPALTALSLDIHANPELGLAEYHAAEQLTDLLQRHDFTVEKGIAGMPTAFVANYGHGTPVISFLCEYDALPGLGHGCGHNLIAAGGVGAAIAARYAMPNDISGTIRCIGTPGEEGAGGKIIELEAGVFSDVDAALMWHPSSSTQPWRHATAAVHLDVEYHGIAAHAAGNPHDGRSALAAVIQLFVSLDALRQFIPETARLHGIITNGGQAPNVVPEHAAATLMVRALTKGAVTELLARVEACAHAAAAATGTTVSLAAGKIYAERKNNHTIATRTAAHLTRLGERVDQPVLRGGTGSSDIGNVSLALPAIHPYLQIMPTGTPSHSRAMAEAAATPRAQEAMLHMAEALAATGIELLVDPELITTAREEFASNGPDLPI